MADQQTYHGSCHCGAVRYEAKSAPLTEAISCNCSMCRRKGTLLAFIPASDFTLQSSAETLTDYQFNHKVVHHLFCRTCGVTSFARGTMPNGSETVALNLRCVDEIDPGTLKITSFDGKSL